MSDQPDSVRHKALRINLDATTYGTFAEIGGGQEVAGWFFAVGGAAGTIAKSISAYDMAVSDAIYGPAPRYVSRERLTAMLNREFTDLRERLDATRGADKCFFVFADTAATKGHQQDLHGRAWLGIRFQTQPRREPSDIIIHAYLLDSTAARQRDVLGILGVNLVHAAFYNRENPQQLILSLMDGLSRDQIELDMIKLCGPAFPNVDDRLISLQLVEQNLTHATMFTAAGEIVQPSEVLYKKPILVERGSFRPVTNLTLDLLVRARERFCAKPSVKDQQPIVLAEMTLRSLVPGPEVGHADFLARAEILGALGFNVLISRFEPYYELADYLAAYTDRPIGIALGLPAIRQIINDKYYAGLAGGVLESIGRLFKRSVTLYVFPTRDAVTGKLQTLREDLVQPPWHYLRDLLLAMGNVEPIMPSDEAYLSIQTPDVLARIQRGDPTWKTMVPPVVADLIVSKKLFGADAK